MLIRLFNDELVEYPSDLVALMLASPDGVVPNLSIPEIDCLIHAMLGSLFNEELNLEQNIELLRRYCVLMGSPSVSDLEEAHAQIKHYMENIAVADIGYSDKNTINAIFDFQSSKPNPIDGNVIDNAPDSGQRRNAR